MGFERLTERRHDVTQLVVFVAAPQVRDHRCVWDEVQPP